MSNKPIFVATHPRACSTAFERVFMTRRDQLKCVHEPFGDAYYFGPERLAERFAEDEERREASGFSLSTYQKIMERINLDNTEGKRLLIKDMAQYFFPPSHKAVSIAPSLLDKKRGVGTNGAINGDAPTSNGHTLSTDDRAPSTNGDMSLTNGQTTLTNGHSAVTNGQNAMETGHNTFTNGHNSATNGHDALTNGHSPHVNGNGPTTNGHAKQESAGSHFVTKAEFRLVQSHSNPAVSDAPYPTFTEVENPTVVPTALLEQFHFAFLIRHPKFSIPSYYRCCIPPLAEVTGFDAFRPDEAGYQELRRFFDYLRASGQIGSTIAGQPSKSANGNSSGQAEICMIDADDLLDNPEGIMSTFCKSVGVDWTADMLNWNSNEEKQFAQECFEKWRGFHEDAIHSTDLKARDHRHVKTDEQLYNEWTEKYGKTGADVIRQTVADCIDDYEYLKSFCIKV